MRTHIPSFLFLTLLVSLFYSCSEEVGTHTITYQSATPIYEHRSDLNREIRLESPRAVNDISKIYIGKDYLLVGEQDQGIHLIDNQDKFNPTAIGFIPIRSNKEFFVDGDILYADSFADMLKISIEDPRNPELLFRLENALVEDKLEDDQGRVLVGFDFEEKTISSGDANRLYDEYWNENYAYYVFVDFQNSLLPNSALPVSFTSSVNGTSGTANRIAKGGDYLYTITFDRLSVFRDLGDRSDISKIDNIRDLWQAETIYIQDETMIIGTRTGVDFRDLSNPTYPERVSTFVHAEACDPVLPHGDVAYVTLRSNDDCGARDLDLLLTLDIQNTFRPFLKSEHEMNSPYGMAIIQDKLYVAEGTFGISVFDISDIHSPSFLYRISDIEAYDLLSDPSENSIILVATPQGLGQYKIEGGSGQNLSLLSIIGS